MELLLSVKVTGTGRIIIAALNMTHMARKVLWTNTWNLTYLWGPDISAKTQMFHSSQVGSVTVFFSPSSIWKMDFYDTNTGSINRLHTCPVYSNLANSDSMLMTCVLSALKGLLLISLWLIIHYYSSGKVQCVLAKRGGQLGCLGWLKCIVGLLQRDQKVCLRGVGPW